MVIEQKILKIKQDFLAWFQELSPKDKKDFQGAFGKVELLTLDKVLDRAYNVSIGQKA